MTIAISAQGTTIERGDGASPEVFSAVPEVKSIGGPDGTAAELDATSLSSAAKEFLLGLRDEGKISLPINYAPKNAVHAALRADYADSGLHNYRITFSDGSPSTVWDFTARVVSFAINGTVDQILTATVTLKISGAITETTE